MKESRRPTSVDISIKPVVCKISMHPRHSTEREGPEGPSDRLPLPSDALGVWFVLARLRPDHISIEDRQEGERGVEAGAFVARRRLMGSSPVLPYDPGAHGDPMHAEAPAERRGKEVSSVKCRLCQCDVVNQ